MLKSKKLLIAAAIAVCLAWATAAMAADVVFQYPVKQPGHPGGDLTPAAAYEMVKKNAHAFIVDVRSRPEYVLIGHPTMAYHVPIMTWTGKYTSKGYGMAMNNNFYQDLKAKFNPATDTLIFMCRSGGRSCTAAKAAVQGGWPADKVYNLLGGFEGDKDKNKASAFHGQRIMGGWKNEGLPWTYKVDPKLAYAEVK